MVLISKDGGGRLIKFLFKLCFFCFLVSKFIRMTERSCLIMEPRKPSLALTLVVFLAAALLIGASVLVWEVDIHIALILSAMIAIAVGVVVLKYDYATIEKVLLTA